MAYINGINIFAMNGRKKKQYKTLSFSGTPSEWTTNNKLNIAHALIGGTGTTIIPELHMIYHSWPISLNGIPDKLRYNVFTNQYSRIVWARFLETDYNETTGESILKLELRTLSSYVRGVTISITHAEASETTTSDIVYWDNMHKVDQDYIDSYDWFIMYYDDGTSKYRWPIGIRVVDGYFTRLRIDGNGDATQNNIFLQTSAMTDVTEYQAGLIYPDSDHMNQALYQTRVTDINADEAQIKDNSERLDLILSERSSLFVSR